MGDASEIHKLTDDCLIEIFQRLPTIADKLRIERVCRRWQNVSKRSWNNFKSLDFAAKTWGIQKGGLIRSIDLDKIMRLSGRFLTSVSTDVDKFGRICHLLSNVRELQLRDDCVCYKQTFGCPRQCTYDAWQVTVSWLVSHGENVTNFKIEIRHGSKAEDFAKFFRKMKELKSFYLNVCNSSVNDFAFLLELPFEKLEEIVLNTLELWSQLDMDQSLTSTMIKKCKKLRTLSIECLTEHGGTIGVFEGVPSQANTLKNLRLSFSRGEFHSSIFSTMSALTHLEKLDVEDCMFMNDAFLEVVGKNCKQLTYLNLNYCHKVTDRGISAICKLDKLTCLCIKSVENIRNPPLKKLTNLMVLDASWNSYIEEKCLCSFLEKAHKLRALVVDHCRLVTNKLLNLAIEIAKTRSTNDALDLYVGVTDVAMNVMYDEPPLLNIVFSDFWLTFVQYGIENPFLTINCPEVHTPLVEVSDPNGLKSIRKLTRGIQLL